MSTKKKKNKNCHLNYHTLDHHFSWPSLTLTRHLQKVEASKTDLTGSPAKKPPNKDALSVCWGLSQLAYFAFQNFLREVLSVP